jgi:hypothetical protein
MKSCADSVFWGVLLLVLVAGLRLAREEASEEVLVVAGIDMGNYATAARCREVGCKIDEAGTESWASGDGTGMEDRPERRDAGWWAEGGCCWEPCWKEKLAVAELPFAVLEPPWPDEKTGSTSLTPSASRWPADTFHWLESAERSSEELVRNSVWTSPPRICTWTARASPPKLKSSFTAPPCPVPTC